MNLRRYKVLAHETPSLENILERDSYSITRYHQIWNNHP